MHRAEARPNTSKTIRLVEINEDQNTSKIISKSLLDRESTVNTKRSCNVEETNEYNGTNHQKVEEASEDKGK